MRKKRKTKLLRTALLGLAAFAAVIYGLHSVWEIPIREVIAVILAGVMIVAITALAGFLTIASLHLIRRFRGKSKKIEVE